MHWPLGKLDFADAPLVMGVLNITPDSFSDGGKWLDTDTATSRALEMVSHGAAIIDIGPESSRPGSDRVHTDEQIRRAVPVILQISKQTNAQISIDTYDPLVAEAALEAGASIINDITALQDDQMAQLAAQRGAAVILMHMQGTPESMQANPTYEDVTKEVLDFLLERVTKAQDFGIAPQNIILDPGIGFGKTTDHNLQLLADMDTFTQTPYRTLIGASRKRFLGSITGHDNPADRIFATAATVALSATAGIDIVRVHDIAPMVDVIKTVSAIAQAKISTA